MASRRGRNLGMADWEVATKKLETGIVGRKKNKEKRRLTKDTRYEIGSKRMNEK